jgi:uncharacterized protein YegP (UPF0339 family)
MKPTVEIYQSASFDWRWRVKHGNGKILTASSEGFFDKSGAKRNLKRVKAAFAAITVALVAGFLMLTTGCANTGGSHTLPDGSKIAVHSQRFLWVSEGVNFTAKDPSGFSASLATSKTGSDPASIDALGKVIEAAINSAVKAALAAKAP